MRTGHCAAHSRQRGILPLMTLIRFVFAAFLPWSPVFSSPLLEQRPSTSAPQPQSLYPPLGTHRRFRRTTSLPDWSADPTLYPLSMSITALVRVRGVVQTSGALGAFVGEEVRGSTQDVTPIPVGLGPYGGGAAFEMLIYAERTGVSVSFRFADGCSAG